MATSNTLSNPPNNLPSYLLISAATIGLLFTCIFLSDSTNLVACILCTAFCLIAGLIGIAGATHGESRASKVVPAFAVMCIFLLVVQILLTLYKVPTGLIPTPSKVVQSLIAARGVLLKDAYNTFFLESFLGFLGGTTAGIVLALLSVRFRFLERGLLPYAALLSSVPIVALAPIVIKAFGLGFVSKTVVVAITVMFPVVINAVRGLNSASPMHLDLMHSYAASQKQIFRSIRWPGALPFIFTALKIGATLSLINAIVAEFFGTEGNGLGFRILIEAGRFNLDIVWAAIVVASFLGIMFYSAITWIESSIFKK